VRENWFTGMGCSSVEEYKNKKKQKVTVPVYVAHTWRLDRSSDPNRVNYRHARMSDWPT